MSRSNDESGTVVLRVLVKADGTAGAVEVKTSSGYARLDESARSTVQTWRFKPATVNGTPVEEWYQVAIPFTLQNN
jgi:periplasmic protein TonB